MNSDGSPYTTSNLVFNYVRIERRDAIATLVLDRPERLNAVEARMRGEIVPALRQLVDDERVRVVVLTGAGRAFCAGADIGYLRQLKEEEDLQALADLVDAGGQAALLIRGAPKPVIAAVNGPAAGGGANLALACDLRIASERASIGQTFVRIGLHPDWGGTFVLPRIVGASRALELMWTGRMVEAHEALELGLFDRVVPAEELEGEVARLAGALAAAAPEAVARIKAAVYAATGDDLDGALARERQSQIALFRSTDADEGLRAFVEKRAPVFGRGAGARAGGEGAAARRPERG